MRCLILKLIFVWRRFQAMLHACKKYFTCKSSKRDKKNAADKQDKEEK